jgi:hypothetical protein
MALGSGCGSCSKCIAEMSRLEEHKVCKSSFQESVADWMLNCFGREISRDTVERNHRFLEEALELVQACGATAEEAHQLVDYVFNRPVGAPAQEVGGVMVTLAALCNAQRPLILVDHAARTELDRVNAPKLMAAIREKQKTKPAFSPLPGSYPERGQPAMLEPHHARVLLSFIESARTSPCGNYGQDIGKEAEEVYTILKQLSKQADRACNKMPTGWVCSRPRGHSGPCAASPIGEGK